MTKMCMQRYTFTYTSFPNRKRWICDENHKNFTVSKHCYHTIIRSYCPSAKVYLQRQPKQKGGRNEEILSGSQRRARGMHARGDHSPPGNERQRDAGIPAPKRNIRQIPVKRDPVITANTWKTCNTISYGNKTERGFEHERVCNTENDRGNICSK